MRTTPFLLVPALVLSAFASSAQDINEAYNLSNLTVQGTARSMGFGNALGSVGGDFSSLSVNPAGIGIYRSSEVTFTPSLRINSASSSYINSTTSDNNTHFNINNFGLVFTHAPRGKRYNHSNWKAVSVGLGMNRVADFNRNYTYQGKNTTSSASQALESDANLYPGDVQVSGPSNNLGYMGYQSYLLNQNANGQYTTIVPFTGGVNQLKSVQQNGGIDEFVISLGGNYKEKLMLGATLGLTAVNYQSTSYYQETLSSDNTAANPSGFNSFSYNQNLSVTGGGVNLKIGAIYKITDFIRVGAAFHSPTYYWLSDDYSPGVTSNHNDSIVTLSTDNGALYSNHFDYGFTTPWKGIISGTFILKNLGFITADYEYVDYSTMQYLYPSGMDASGNSYKQSQDAMNQSIKNTYQAVSNVRVGAEILLSKYFMIRGGFGYYGNPYKNSDYNGQRIDISGGLGFHFRHFFTDVALVHSMYKSEEQPYTVDYTGVISGPQVSVPVATTNFSANNLALTIGTKF